MTRHMVQRIAEGILPNILRSQLRNELDEVKNAMKRKTTMNLDGMIKRTDSPFIASVLECPCLPNFVSLSWRSTMALRTLWTT